MEKRDDLLKKFPLWQRTRWEEVPVTARKDIEDWTLEKCKDRPTHISFTSGSSGKPLTLFHSREALRAKTARAKRLFEVLYEKEEIIWSFLARECITRVSLEMGLFEFGKLCISFGLPSEKKKNILKAALQKNQPAAVLITTGALPSLLELEIPFSVKYAFIGGSLGTEEFRRWVESSLGCHYIDCYATNEFGLLAATTNPETREMTVFENELSLEILDEKQQIKEEGEGLLLVTDYANHCMPFIRYVLGDKVDLKRVDGKTTIRILGRTDTLFNFDQSLVSLQEVVETTTHLLGHEKFYITIGNIEKTLYDYARLHIPGEDRNKECILKEELQHILRKPPMVITTEKFVHAPNGKFLHFFDLRKTDDPAAHW